MNKKWTALFVGVLICGASEAARASFASEQLQCISLEEVPMTLETLFPPQKNLRKSDSTNYSQCNTFTPNNGTFAQGGASSTIDGKPLVREPSLPFKQWFGNCVSVYVQAWICPNDGSCPENPLLDLLSDKVKLALLGNLPNDKKADALHLEEITLKSLSPEIQKQLSLDLVNYVFGDADVVDPKILQKWLEELPRNLTESDESLQLFMILSINKIMMTKEFLCR